MNVLTALLASQPLCWQPALHHSFCLVFPQSRRPVILPTPGSQSTASGLLGPRIHPSAHHGLWASSPMMCNRRAGGQAVLGLGSRGPCFFARQFLARGGNECSRNLGVGWWRQDPGIQGTYALHSP